MTDYPFGIGSASAIAVAIALFATACSDVHDEPVADAPAATKDSLAAHSAPPVGELVDTVPASDDSQAAIVERNQRIAQGNHHDHSAHHVPSLRDQPPRMRVPGTPQFADRFEGPYRPVLEEQHRATSRTTVDGVITARPTLHGGNCVLDFATPNLMQYWPGGTTYWADRTLIPWLRDCGQAALLDLRWSKYNHMHVGFEDPDIGFCFSDPDASPAYIDDEGHCTLVDLNSTPRSFVTTHGWDEVLVLSAYYQNDYARVPFDLERIHVVYPQGARVCYRKSDTSPGDGPWEAAEVPGPGTNVSTVGGWYCWLHLDAGHWDLSAWADDVIAVKITGSAVTPGTFAIDDIHVVVH